jgi:hypothetical protein
MLAYARDCCVLRLAQRLRRWVAQLTVALPSMSGSSSSEDTFAPSLKKWLDHILPWRAPLGERLEPPATPDIFATDATVAGTA